MSRIKDYSNLSSLADLVALDEYNPPAYDNKVLSKCCQASVDSIIAPGMEHILNERDKDIKTRYCRYSGDYIYICTKCGKEDDFPGWTRIERSTREEYQKRRELDGY